MAGGETDVRMPEVFVVETSRKYENNLQKALDYSFHHWGATTMVEFHVEVNKEIDSLQYFPYANAKTVF